MGKDKKSFYKKAGVSFGIIVSVFVIGMFLTTQVIPFTKIIQDANNTVKIGGFDTYIPTWHVIWEGSLAEAAEANPGTGASGFLEIFWINHTATPATAYLQNTSATLEAWCVANMPGLTPYASADNFNVQIASNKLFDIVVRCRWNKTVCFDYNKNMFIGVDVRVNISVSGGGITISGASSGTNVNSYNSSTANYLWTNTYWNSGGTGYYIQKGGTSTVAYISLQARY